MTRIIEIGDGGVDWRVVADQDDILPTHIKETVRAIADLHARHQKRVSPLERLVGRSVEEMGRPRFVALLTGFFLLWLVVNRVLALVGVADDLPPLEQTKTVVEFIALYLAILILVNQRHDDRVARLREQLTLELTILGEEKSAKIIALLQAMRRDDPALADRPDPEADAMSQPAKPEEVLQVIEDKAGTDGRGEVFAADQPDAS